MGPEQGSEQNEHKVPPKPPTRTSRQANEARSYQYSAEYITNVLGLLQDVTLEDGAGFGLELHAIGILAGLEEIRMLPPENVQEEIITITNSERRSEVLKSLYVGALIGYLLRDALFASRTSSTEQPTI